MNADLRQTQPSHLEIALLHRVEPARAGTVGPYADAVTEPETLERYLTDRSSWAKPDAAELAGSDVVYDPDVRITHYHTPAMFRNLWRNIHSMRLYLFFKHFPPRGVGAWLRFATIETGMLFRDLWDQLGAFSFNPKTKVAALGYPKWLAKMIVLRGIEMLKVLLARTAVPYLFWRARKTRLEMGLST